MERIKSMVRNFVVASIMAVCIFGLPLTLTYLYFNGDTLQQATVWVFAQFGQDSWTEEDAKALNNLNNLLAEIKKEMNSLRAENVELRKELEWTKKAQKEYLVELAELIIWAHENGKLDTMKYVKRRFGGRIKKAAEKYGVKKELIVAVITTEWDKRNLISKKGAKGPMGLMPRTAKILKVNPDHEFENILGGAKYLAQLQKRFPSLELVIASYNAGPTVVAKLGDIPPYNETINYVKRVMLIYNVALAC